MHDLYGTGTWPIKSITLLSLLFNIFIIPFVGTKTPSSSHIWAPINLYVGYRTIPQVGPQTSPRSSQL